MTPSVSRLFSEQDLSRIKHAVEDAEKKTSGEIVPYVVQQSDDYERAVWRGASAAGGLAVLIFLAVHAFTVLCYRLLCRSSLPLSWLHSARGWL